MFISPSPIVEGFTLLVFIVELELVFVVIFEEPGVAGMTWTVGLTSSICSPTAFSSSASLHRLFSVLGPFIYSPRSELDPDLLDPTDDPGVGFCTSGVGLHF